MTDRMRKVRTAAGSALRGGSSSSRTLASASSPSPGVRDVSGPAPRDGVRERARLRAQARALARGAGAAHGVFQARLAREVRLKWTPTLTFEYDPTVEEGVRMSKLIDDLAPTTMSDVAAVAAATARLTTASCS